MSSDRERAWQYHQAADELLHSRIEAMLIAQAFLVIGYAQILTSQDFCKREDLRLALLAVVALAILLTLLMLVVTRGLSLGLRHLKSEYLAHPESGDPVYAAYLSKVRGAWFPRIWSGWMPFVFLAFWLVTAIHAVAFVIGRLKC